MATAAYLLDTHTLIWFQENNPKITADAMSVIQNPDNIIFFSQVNLFEITIKQKVGKLPEFYATIEDVYNQAIKDGFTFLQIQNKHLFNYNNVPIIQDHRDPFDRLLIATAETEDAAIISADEKLKLYNELITVLW